MTVGISEVLGEDSGVPVSMVCGDKALQLSRLTKGCQARFEEMMKASDLAGAEALRGRVTEHRLNAIYASLAGRMSPSSGYYRFGGEACLERMASFDGMVDLLAVLLHKHHPDMERQEVEALIVSYPQAVQTAIGRLTAMAKNEPPPAAK